MTILRMTESEYHSDPCPRPSLSASLAHTLLSRSPAHAYRQHPRLGGVPRKDRAEFDQGQLIHRLVLGEGRKVAVVQADSWRTKAAKEERDAIRSAGQIPVLAHKYEAAKYIAKVILQRIGEFGIALDGDSEIAVLWSEQASDGSEVLCRGMMDHLILSDARATIIDLKTCHSAHPRACQSHIVGYGYDIQAAAYTSAIEHERPDLAGRAEYLWVFAEMEPPYLVTPIRFAGSMAQLGTSRWDRAVQLWHNCLERDHWPGYAEAIITCDAPQWALTAEIEQDLGEPHYTREDGPTYGVTAHDGEMTDEQLKELGEIF